MADFLSRLALVGILAGGVCYLPVNALADESGDSSALPSRAQGIFDGIPAIDGDKLDVFRGGTESLTLEMNKSSGVVSDNQAYNLTTGSNYISEGSLAGASGFPTVIQNSGNNVLIQNSTIINLQLK